MAAAILVTAAVPPVVPSAMADVAHPDWPVVARCIDFTHSVVTLTDHGFSVHDPSGYDWDESILSPRAWQVPSADPVRSLHVYGLSWIRPLLVRLEQTQDVARLDALVTRVAATLDWRPDNGLRTDPVWNEGAVVRRQQAANCLYELTGDPRLRRLLLALVRAGSDPVRYYGPPASRPHNHGLMSNLALLETARLLGRGDIKDFAVRRLSVAIRGAFTPAGMSIEQSTFYHLANVLGWAQAERVLRGLGEPRSAAVADRIAAVLVQARAASAFLTDPSGRPVPWGDGAPPVQPTTRQRSLTFVDRIAGVVTGRWRWSTTTDFYGVRFGSPRSMHGHEDRMSVVWSALGIPVVVDAGTATYAPGVARRWTLDLTTHSAAVVAGRAFQPGQVVTLTRWTRSGPVHGVSLRGRAYGVDQLRAVLVDWGRHVLSLDDRVASGSVVQVLQLDPRWLLLALAPNGRTAVFQDGAGHRLQLSTTARVTSVRRGQPGLAGGWTFRYPPTVATAAARILISGGSHVVTTLRVVTGG